MYGPDWVVNRVSQLFHMQFLQKCQVSHMATSYSQWKHIREIIKQVENRSGGAVSDLFKAGGHHCSGESRLVSYQSVMSKYVEGTYVHLCMVKSHLSSPNQALSTFYSATFIYYLHSSWFADVLFLLW